MFSVHVGSDSHAHSTLQDPGLMESLSRAFTKEALNDIAEWAVTYCLETYGFVPGFEGVDLGMSMSSEGGGEDPWDDDMARGDYLMARPNRSPQDVEAAIALYVRASDMIPRSTHAIEWGSCNASLGIAYAERGREGGVRDDLTRAVTYLKHALSVLDQATHAQQFGEVHHELGAVQLQLALMERSGSEDRPENLAAAIESFQKCLEVFTEAAHPAERAEVQEMLQEAYHQAAGLIEDESGYDDGYF